MKRERKEQVGPSMGLSGMGARPEGQTTGPSLSTEGQQERWPMASRADWQSTLRVPASGAWELHQVVSLLFVVVVPEHLQRHLHTRSHLSSA